MNNKALAITAGVGCVAWLLGYAAGRALRSKAEKAFVLIIEVEFKNVKDRDTWVAGFRELAAHCEKHEPGTLGYDVAYADNNELKVLVYERYSSKAAHAQLHALSPEYLAFKEAMKGISFASKRGQSYIEQNVGYIRREAKPLLRW